MQILGGLCVSEGEILDHLQYLVGSRISKCRGRLLGEREDDVRAENQKSLMTQIEPLGLFWGGVFSNPK